MVNAIYIAYDLNNVIVAIVRGGSGISIAGCYSTVVANVPSGCTYATHTYDPETGEIYVNPDYETETAAGKVYKINVGWVYPEETPDK